MRHLSPRIGLAELALKDGDEVQARRLLDWCLEHYPALHTVVAPYTSLLLRAGVDAEVAVAEVERRVESVTPTMRVMLGSVLQDAGALPAAERQYRLAVADQPDNAQARVALADTLLCVGDPAGAASQAALVPEDDPCAGVAFGLRLCALISGGNLGAAAASWARARAGLSQVENEVFGTWLAIASGVPSPRPLSIATASVLEAVLETLLRARSFTQFELLLPALENSALPTRQRRELLGEIYLRQGFLASAAKEWMAVCADQPDAGALLGLARVAAANHQPQDAVVFASGALESEPENVAAAEILARASSDCASHDPAAEAGGAAVSTAD